MVIRGVVLDLDDTLYLERDYVRSGFRAVSERFAAKSSASSNQMHKLLLAIARDPKHRGMVFNELLQREPGLAAKATVQDMVGVYRLHRPTITMVPGVADLLDDIGGGNLQLGMITDGPVISQQAKLAALGLEGIFDPTIITDAWGIEFHKPHHRAFEMVETLWGCSGDELVYVGDNPHKDFIAPRQRGWRSVRITMAGQLHEAALPSSVDTSAEAAVSSLGGLRSLVRSWQPPYASLN